MTVLPAGSFDWTNTTWNGAVTGGLGAPCAAADPMGAPTIARAPVTERNNWFTRCIGEKTPFPSTIRTVAGANYYKNLHLRKPCISTYGWESAKGSRSEADRAGRCSGRRAGGGVRSRVTAAR